MYNEKFDFYNPINLKSYNLDQTMRYQLDILGNLDNFTRKHSENVANLTCRICEYMHASQKFTIYCTICAYLHDIGKLFIPASILQKPTKLTDEEFNNIKIDYNIADEISPDNEIGDNLGYIDILVNDEIIDTYHFYLKDEIFSYHQQSQLVILVIIGLSFLVIILLCLNILGYRKK